MTDYENFDRITEVIKQKEIELQALKSYMKTVCPHEETFDDKINAEGEPFERVCLHCFYSEELTKLNILKR